MSEVAKVGHEVEDELEKGLHLHHHLGPRHERAMFATLVPWKLSRSRPRSAPRRGHTWRHDEPTARELAARQLPPDHPAA